jgi:hypothetical protein
MEAMERKGQASTSEELGPVGLQLEVHFHYCIKKIK